MRFKSLVINNIVYGDRPKQLIGGGQYINSIKMDKQYDDAPSVRY